LNPLLPGTKHPRLTHASRSTLSGSYDLRNGVQSLIESPSSGSKHSLFLLAHADAVDARAYRIPVARLLLCAAAGD